MRLLACLTVATAFLLVPAWARAHTSGSNSQSQGASCAIVNLPLNTGVKVTLKDGRKIKGKLLARHNDQFEISVGVKVQTIACSAVTRIEKNRGFGRRLRVVAAIPVMLAGVVIALPGLIVAKAGAKDAGLIIAAPGLAIVVGGYILSGDDDPMPWILLFY
ncbi:MAG: hypothetical protein AB7U82_31010 [Blastocatellales bacterium]